MRLDHLTFAQLHKLKDESTLIRVTAAYHKALGRHWDDNDGFGSIEFYTVTLAEAYCPEFCEHWRRVIQFLRSNDLKSALRRSAATTPIPPSVCVSVYRVLEERLIPHFRRRHALAMLIVRHCERHGVPACVLTRPSDGAHQIVVATDEAGQALLDYKPGILWEEIQQLCDALDVDPNRVFWWLPWTDDKTGWRINPALWPVNTPDYQETAKELVEK